MVSSINTFLSKFAPAHRFVEARSRGEESLYLLSSEDEARIIHLFDLSRAWMPQLGVRTEDCSEARVTVQQLLCIWAWARCLVRSGGASKAPPKCFQRSWILSQLLISIVWGYRDDVRQHVTQVPPVFQTRAPLVGCALLTQVVEVTVSLYAGGLFLALIVLGCKWQLGKALTWLRGG